MADKIIDSNYGSIPHLSTSKLTQQADKKINQGQEKILTEKARDWKDLIIVTEKIDGSNVGIINKLGVCSQEAITRKGYPAYTSRFEFHKAFFRWVNNHSNLFEWLPLNWRVVGEWCALAHGTLYDLTNESPFVAFDIFTNDNKRLCYIDFIKICSRYKISMVPLLHIGQPISIKNALELLGKGHYGNPETPEGVVYRVERNNKVDFLAKWVRADKEDGKYLKQEIYNKGFKL